MDNTAKNPVPSNHFDHCCFCSLTFDKHKTRIVTECLHFVCQSCVSVDQLSTDLVSETFCRFCNAPCLVLCHGRDLTESDLTDLVNLVNDKLSEVHEGILTTFKREHELVCAQQLFAARISQDMTDFRDNSFGLTMKSMEKYVTSKTIEAQLELSDLEKQEKQILNAMAALEKVRELCPPACKQPVEMIVAVKNCYLDPIEEMLNKIEISDSPFNPTIDKTQLDLVFPLKTFFVNKVLPNYETFFEPSFLDLITEKFFSTKEDVIDKGSIAETKLKKCPPLADPFFDCSRQVVIALLGFSHYELIQYSYLVKNLGGNLLAPDNVLTHLVVKDVNCINRSVLWAIASGAYLIKRKFLQDARLLKKFPQQLKDYEWRVAEGQTQEQKDILQASIRSSRSSQSGKAKFFDGINLFLLGEDSQHREEGIKLLVVAGGGQFRNKFPIGDEAWAAVTEESQTKNVIVVVSKSTFLESSSEQRLSVTKFAQTSRAEVMFFNQLINSLVTGHDLFP